MAMTNSKKGAEAIIAIVLILMITIASAGTLFFWYSRVQQQAQGRAEHSTSVFLNQIVSCVKLPSFTYNLLTNESEVEVQNCGTTSVTIGDGDEGGLVTSEQCAFNISSANCDVCPFVIGPGALGRFTMYANRTFCSGALASKTLDMVMAAEGNIQHKITLSIDKSTTTASKDFIPTKTLSCTIILSQPANMFGLGFPPPPITRCINYTATADSSIPQTYDLSASTNPYPNCVVTGIYDGAGCAGSNITQKTLPAKGTGTFSVNVTANWLAVPCTVTAKMTSTDLQSCSDSNDVWLKATP